MRKLLAAYLAIALLVSGCASALDALGAGVLNKSSEHVHSAGAARVLSSASYGVSATSPVAQAVLVRVYETNKGSTLTPVDATTGLPIANLTPLHYGESTYHALSPDGTLLATITYPTYEARMRGALLLTDLETWTTVTTTVPITNTASTPVFSPDGSKLALVRQRIAATPEYMLQIVEIRREPSTGDHASHLSAHRLGESAPLVLNPILLAFSSDGSAVHLYGSNSPLMNRQYNPQVQVASYNVDTLLPEWQQALDTLFDGQYVTEEEEEKVSANYWDPHIGKWWQPGRVFSSDGDLLYLVHANEDRMTTVDFARKQATVHTVAPRMSLVEQLLAWTSRPAHAKILNGVQLEAALNYDGSSIFVTGREMNYANNNFNVELLPLRIIESSSGRLIAEGEQGTIAYHADIDLRVFLGVHNPNGAASRHSESTIVADPATGAMLNTIEEWTIFPARRLDGAAILLGSRYASNMWGRELAIIEPETWAPIPLQMDANRGWGEWIAP